MRLRELFSTENYCKPQDNAFKEASIVGSSGVEELLPLLEKASFRYVTTDKGALSEFLQKSAGDVIFNCQKKNVWTVEIKTEARTTGNFYLETWSNRSRLTPGWLQTLQADLLWYYFKDAGKLYSIPFPKLQDWAYRKRGLCRYQEKEQKKYNQLNDTWGVCVPILVIEKEVGFKTFTKGRDF